MAPLPSKPPAPARPRPRFPMPWGLFIALGVYALAVLAYVKVQYWDAPEYQAAEHYAQALSVLGVDDGRKCTEPQLVEAMEHVLEAARLVPDQKALAEHAERLRWRFDERKFRIPRDLERHAEMVSATALRREREKDPLLVVGLRDRGWGPEQLLSGPRRAVLWSIPGGVLIILVWAYGRFNVRAIRAREHEADLKASEAEVKSLGQFRERPQPTPAPRDTAEEDEEDEDTRTDPPKPAAPPKRGAAGAKSAARPASSGGRHAVSRPPTGGRSVPKKRPPDE